MFHRVTEQLRLEGTCKDQPPYSKQGHQKAAQDCVLLGSEHLYKLSEQPGPVFHHLHTKKMFSHVEVGLPVFQFWLLPLTLLLGTTGKSLAPPSLLPLLGNYSYG